MCLCAWNKIHINFGAIKNILCTLVEVRENLRRNKIIRILNAITSLGEKNREGKPKEFKAMI